MPDVVFTTTDSLPARNSGNAARVSMIGATRSTSIMLLISASVVSSRRPALTPPALLTRTSRPPSLSRANASVFARPSSVPTSAAIASTNPPFLRSLSADVYKRQGLRPLMTIFAPLASNASVIAKPIPLEPPVTSARFPSSFMSNSCVLPIDSDGDLGKVRRKQCPLGLLVDLLLEGMALADRPRLRDSRTGIDRLEQALDVRKSCKRIAITGKYARGAVEPAPG